jgi:hypothetical protein
MKAHWLCWIKATNFRPNKKVVLAFIANELKLFQHFYSFHKITKIYFASMFYKGFSNSDYILGILFRH